jgi:Domain of unknown function (DUF4404)
VTAVDDGKEELRRLADELADAASAGDAKAGEALEHVERYLDAEAPEDHDDLADRLSDALLHLETSHPHLAATIQAVINSLTASGI